jgi:oligopeptide transport system ATP-binding protein
MADELMVRVTDLVKHFRVPGKRRHVVHAVDGVSFAIKKGQTLGLVGESGCGKSTIARTVVRMYKPTAGSIVLDSHDISQMSKRELRPLRRKMQMIFQDPYSSLNPRMTVLNLVAEPIIAQGLATNARQVRDQVVAMLEEVGLSADHASRYPHEFSGGQRQRISVARALILKPEFVICDEPISALDVSIQAQVINLLQRFKQEQTLSYLFIAHDLSMVRYVSDDVGVMYLGKMMELCDSEEIYRNPLHPYTRGLLAALPVPDPAAARRARTIAVRGDLPSPISPPSGCRFHTRCKEAMAVCRTEEPPLQDQGNGHHVACHLYR